MSRLLSGTRLESGLSLDEIQELFLRFVQTLSRQKSVLSLDQTKTRFESGLSLDEIQDLFLRFVQTLSRQKSGLSLDSRIWTEKPN